MLQRDNCVLLVVDVQQRLAPAIHQHEAVVDRCGLLIEAAKRLDVPVVASEQYPKGLGQTLPNIAEKLGDAPRLPKLAFSCANDRSLREAVESTGRRQLVVCGMEAHVCVLQTVLGFRDAGWSVATVADATGSRRPESRELALARMREHGAEIVDSEMVVFEWLQQAGSDTFRELSRLIK